MRLFFVRVHRGENKSRKSVLFFFLWFSFWENRRQTFPQPFVCVGARDSHVFVAWQLCCCAGAAWADGAAAWDVENDDELYGQETRAKDEGSAFEPFKCAVGRGNVFFLRGSWFRCSWAKLVPWQLVLRPQRVFGWQLLE